MPHPNESPVPDPAMPRSARLFGADHSPWVQAVLLGLHARGIPHQYSVVPPLRLFIASGIFMPAVRLDGGPWRYDSGRILEALGFAPIPPQDARAMARLFRLGASERTEDAARFWRSWSTVRDGGASPLRRVPRQLLKPIVVLTFFLMIQLALRRGRKPDEARRRAALGHFAAQLGDDRPFLGGDAPEALDLQLFGQVQMLASIPGPTLSVLQAAPELETLRAWVARMQSRFSGYPHLYSGPVFEPRRPGPRPAPWFERLAYWLGCGLGALLLPLSLSASAYSILRVGRSGMRG